MGRTTAKDPQHSFNEKLKSFSESKLLQIVMGSPNVNWYFYDKLCDERSKLTLPDLLHTGRCGLRILHGSFKAG